VGGEPVFHVVGRSTPAVASLQGAQLRAHAGEGWVEVQASLPASLRYAPVFSATVRVQLAPLPVEETPPQARLSGIASQATVRLRSGQTVQARRLWIESGQCQAYLGRAGVTFEISAKASRQLTGWQLEVQPPGAPGWEPLASANEVGAPSPEFKAYGRAAVMLGQTRDGASWVPRSFGTPAPLVGLWKVRGRVAVDVGQWGPWSDVLVVQAHMPLRQEVETLTTVPPAGAQAAWFSASEPLQVPVWVWLP
jgi:hypothetical protein